ncbi:hypothetical protein ACNI5A_31865, partial [Klebsiella pneumoniae]|uniref:hypothetical protein n=1 Tax=Klebsiella pneumoniae TaxID=573 RepID=UPI003A8472B0
VTDDVAMQSISTTTTTLDLTKPVSTLVARGPVESDDDGTRQATLLFPASTLATIDTPSGTKSLSTLTLHQTEFTVGKNGRKA